MTFTIFSGGAQFINNLGDATKSPNFSRGRNFYKVALDKKNMGLRKYINDGTRIVGNKIKEGLGDNLAKEIDLEFPLAITGSVAAVGVVGKTLCDGMYEAGIPQLMYSDKFYERVAGSIVDVPIALSWVAILPFLIGGGAAVGASCGRGLNKVEESITKYL